LMGAREERQILFDIVDITRQRSIGFLSDSKKPIPFGFLSIYYQLGNIEISVNRLIF